MSFPDPPRIVETPDHFWYGAVDLGSFVCGRENTKVERFNDHLVYVTKTFVAKSYEFTTLPGTYDFYGLNESGKKSEN